MNKTFVICLINFTFITYVDAATVVLTVTGRVSETNASHFFPNAPVSIGDTWQAVMTWQYPTIGNQNIEWSYLDLAGRFHFIVNGISWDAGHLAGSLGGTSFNASLFANPTAPAAFSSPERESLAVLTWHGLVPENTNQTTLPLSFADWNLPNAASFELEIRTQISEPNSVWLIKANSFDSMNIRVIPEPAHACLALLSAMMIAGRRRRHPVAALDSPDTIAFE